MAGTELDQQQSKVVNDINLKIAVNTQSHNSSRSSQYTGDTDRITRYLRVYRRVDGRPPWACLPPLNLHPAHNWVDSLELKRRELKPTTWIGGLTAIIIIIIIYFITSIYCIISLFTK